MVRGAQRGRELGCPTANVETLPHTAIPADGEGSTTTSEADDEGSTTTQADEGSSTTEAG